MSQKHSLLRWVEIDRSALKANVDWVLSRLKPQVTLTAVVKADGYGHGAAEVASLALSAGASRLGVRDLFEAAALRSAGITAPILLLAPTLPEQAADAARLEVTPIVDSLEAARALCAQTRRPIPVYVELDFGLGRWGVPLRELDSLLVELGQLKKIRLEGLSAHIDYVPGKNAVEAEEKLGALERLAAHHKKKNSSLIVRAANSAVLMDFPHRQFDTVCVGNLLYGINRSRNKPAGLLRPWTFYARVLSIREVRKGASIGYASEYVAPKRMRIATLPVGYSDGLTMEPAERLIGLGARFQYWGVSSGIKLPLVGRCGISHVLVDATGAPRLKVGDPVALPVRRTAARVPRIYI